MDLNPPIPRLLETNDPPTTEEINVISTSIRATKVSLLSTHRELSQKADINDEERNIFLGKLTSCYDFIRQQSGVIFGIRLLPNEILSTIFALACEQSGPTLNVLKHVSTIQPHIGLSRVCRLWRDVVSQTPDLWVNIPTCGVADSISPLAKLQVIQQYIQCSGAAPLNISLHLRRSTLEEGTTDDWNSVLLVLSQAERWRDLDLTTSDGGLRYLYHRTRIQNRLAHLKALTIRLPQTELLSPDQIVHHNIFLNTPSLRSLRIAVEDPHSVARLLTFPWSTLHSFYGVLPVDATLGSNFHHVTAVLQPHEDVKINPKPGLRVLHVDPSATSPNFTLNQDFPDLKLLKLVNTSQDMLITSLRRMVANSARISKTESLTHLTALEFSLPQLDPIAMASFLEWTPRVTSLSVRNFRVNLLEVFSRTNPAVLPDLSSLVISQQTSTNPKRLATLLTDIATSRKDAALFIECQLPRRQCLSALYVLEGLQTAYREGRRK